MTDLIDTTEMYLRTIIELEEDGVPPLRARIVDALGHSGPTVSQTVSRMERDGLVELRPDRTLELTAEGRRRATGVLRRHRLAERLLVDVIGLDPAAAHAEACRWEHVIGEAVEERLVTLLGAPATSPFGNPVPTRADEADGEGEPPDDSLPLSAVPDGARVSVVRLGEQLQAHEESFAAVLAAGALPGRDCTVVVEQDGARTVAVEGGGRVTLVEPLTRHLMLAPVPVER